MKELETRSGGSYLRDTEHANAATALEDEGMIVSGEIKDGKRVSALAELGKQELERERGREEDIVATYFGLEGDWGRWVIWQPVGTHDEATIR